MAIAKLPTNYTSDVINESIKKRKYKITTNSDGTAYLDDVTNYSKKGSNFDAEDINKISNTINQLIDKTEQQGTDSSGSDSFSPTAIVTKQGNVTTITVTDKNGTTTATISDGEKGEKGDTGAAGPKGDKGEKGDKGDQGFAPTITENRGNSESVYKLDIVTETGIITTPNLMGASGSNASATVDEVLSSTSVNPVQNKAIAQEVDKINKNWSMLGGFVPVIDETTGEITGYKTTVGADTVFPFRTKGQSNFGGIDMLGLEAAVVSVEYHSYEGYEQVTV